MSFMHWHSCEVATLFRPFGLYNRYASWIAGTCSQVSHHVAAAIPCVFLDIEDHTRFILGQGTLPRSCCTNICTYMYIYAHTCTYADIPTYMDMWLLTIYLSIYPSMQKYCVCVNILCLVCMCVCVCVCVKRTYVCIHAYIISYHII